MLAISKASMAPHAARAQEIIEAAKAVPADATMGAGTFDVDPNEAQKDPEYAFRRAVEVLSGYHLVAEEFFDLVLKSDGLTVQECLDLGTPDGIRGIEMYDDQDEETMSYMVDRANDMRRKVGGYTAEQLAAMSPLTVADLPAGLMPIAEPTWRELHNAGARCRNLMVEWFQTYCVCLGREGDVMMIDQ